MAARPESPFRTAVNLHTRHFAQLDTITPRLPRLAQTWTDLSKADNRLTPDELLGRRNTWLSEYHDVLVARDKAAELYRAFQTALDLAASRPQDAEDKPEQPIQKNAPGVTRVYNVLHGDEFIAMQAALAALLRKYAPELAPAAASAPVKTVDAAPQGWGPWLKSFVWTSTPIAVPEDTAPAAQQAAGEGDAAVVDKAYTEWASAQGVEKIALTTPVAVDATGASGTGVATAVTSTGTGDARGEGAGAAPTRPGDVGEDWTEAAAPAADDHVAV
ncbi:MAG: hypothetical protein RL235_854 [Chlamydiota bacterium]